MNADQQIQQEQQREAIQKNFDELCNAALNNPAGKELIKVLTQKFIMQPVADPSLNINHACFREGQNDLVRLFRTAIKRHAKQ